METNIPTQCYSNTWSKPQPVCINEVIYVIFPAPFPSGLNLKTYPEDQVIEESKYIPVHFLLIFKRKMRDV